MKQTTIAALVAAALAFSACEDDCTDMAAPETTITVKSATTSLEAANASGHVTIDAPIASAYTNHSEWLSLTVSGETVSFTAQDNDDPQSRNAILVVKKAEQDSIVVNISQLGLIFVVDNDDIILSSDAAATASFSVQSTREVTIASTPDWIEATVANGKVNLSISANATGSRRVGYVEVAAGAYTDKVFVSQFEFAKDVAGEYTLTYYDIDYEMDLTTKVTLSTSGLYLQKYDLTLPVQFDATNYALTLQSGQQIGTYNDKTAFIVFTDKNYQVSISAAATGKVSAPVVTDAEGNISATFAGSAYTSGSKTTTFAAFAIATSTSGSIDRNTQFPVIMENPKLTK